MANRQLPTPDVLRQLLRYEADTGKLFWLPRAPETFDAKSSATSEHLHRLWNSRKAGRQAFNGKNSRGYFVGSIFDRQYVAHRVAWCIHFGEWPAGALDHINGDRADNRICNLRLASAVENARNSSALSHSSSAFRGVSFETARGKWLASIMIRENGARRRIFLGRHKSERDAARAYDEAAKAHFGEFARLNFR